MKDESPDFLSTPKTGVKRLNKIPAVIAGAVILFGLGSIMYLYADRVNEQARQAQAATEVTKVPTVAVAPVKRPAGPDVAIPPAPPPETYVQEPGKPAPMQAQEPESVRRAREERIAVLKAAMQSSPRVSGFTTSNTPKMEPSRSDTVSDDRARTQQPDQNRQPEKREFLDSFRNPESPYLNQARLAPISETEIKAGSIIPGVMITGINSDLPGQIVGQVRQNVYDSATGRYLLIPAGAKIVGTYDSSVAAGQERVLVAWNRIIFPDSSSISLEGMPGADQSGFAGFNDKVDNHYWRTFGSAFLLSLFSAGIQLSQPQAAVSGTYNSQQIMAAEIGRQLGRLGMQVTQRNLNIQPTLEIRPGFQFSVMVTKDIVLPQWAGH